MKSSELPNNIFLIMNETNSFIFQDDKYSLDNAVVYCPNMIYYQYLGALIMNEKISHIIQ